MQGEVRVTRIDAAHPRARLAKASVQPVQPRSLSQPASGLLASCLGISIGPPPREEPKWPRVLAGSVMTGLLVGPANPSPSCFPNAEHGHILRQLLWRRSGEVRDAFSPERCERTACLARFKTIVHQLLLCQRP